VLLEETNDSCACNTAANYKELFTFEAC